MASNVGQRWLSQSNARFLPGWYDRQNQEQHMYSGPNEPRVGESFGRLLSQGSPDVSFLMISVATLSTLEFFTLG